MDFTNWPPPQLPNSNPYHHSSHYYPHYPPQPQPLDSNLKTYEFSSVSALAPPGVEPYVAVTSYPHVPYDSNQTVDSSAHYSDPNAHNWALKEAVRQFGSDPAAYAGTGINVTPNGIAPVAISNPSSTLWVNPAAQLNTSSAGKKRPKKAKVVQSAYCEICKIDCNSKDVLDQHKLGKKHKKNLEKLQEAAAVGCRASTASSNSPVGPQENPKGKTANGQKSRKKAAAETAEDLETKRRKIVEGGAAAEAVRVCAICNVVCNSETVYNCHLAGQKHASMVKKNADAAILANNSQV